jgi:8-hydroxy-5-deazaflavin:NADPH oxidoreductase
VKIAILGTGMVGQGLAVALRARGHDVMMGTRDVAASLANTTPSAYGLPSFGVWHKNHTDIQAATFAEAARFGELLIHAGNGSAALDVLRLARLETVGSKVMIELSNDLDASKGMPPVSRSSDIAGAGLGEKIQAAYPQLRVVKTLNTMNVQVMVNPALLPGDSTIFMSGNDAEAKQTVRSVLQSLGWQDILDLGDISTSRGVEMLLPLWPRLKMNSGTPWGTTWRPWCLWGWRRMQGGGDRPVHQQLFGAPRVLTSSLTHPA